MRKLFKKLFAGMLTLALITAMLPMYAAAANPEFIVTKADGSPAVKDVDYKITNSSYISLAPLTDGLIISTNGETINGVINVTKSAGRSLSSLTLDNCCFGTDAVTDALYVEVPETGFTLNIKGDCEIINTTTGTLYSAITAYGISSYTTIPDFTIFGEEDSSLYISTNGQYALDAYSKANLVIAGNLDLFSEVSNSYPLYAWGSSNILIKDNASVYAVANGFPAAYSDKDITISTTGTVIFESSNNAALECYGKLSVNYLGEMIAMTGYDSTSDKGALALGSADLIIEEGTYVYGSGVLNDYTDNLYLLSDYYFDDVMGEDLYTLYNDDTLIKTLLFGHKHVGKLIEGVKPTKTSAGYKDYYMCESCGLFYADELLTEYIDDLDAWKAEGGDGYLAPIKEEQPPVTDPTRPTDKPANKETSPESEVSPKTGDFNCTFAIMAMALAAGAGLVFCSKKRAR